MKRRPTLTVAALLAAIALPAAAYVIGGTNLGILGYPEPECREPYRPLSGSSEFAMSQYAEDRRRYFACMREYVENAGNDIQRIQEAVDQAVKDAKKH